MEETQEKEDASRPSPPIPDLTPDAEHVGPPDLIRPTRPPQPATGPPAEPGPPDPALRLAGLAVARMSQLSGIAMGIHPSVSVAAAELLAELGPDAEPAILGIAEHFGATWLTDRKMRRAYTPACLFGRRWRDRLAEWRLATSAPACPALDLADADAVDSMIRAFNSLAGRAYPVGEDRDPAHARLCLDRLRHMRATGCDDAEAVRRTRALVACWQEQWGEDPRMAECVRPSTLLEPGRWAERIDAARRHANGDAR